MHMDVVKLNINIAPTCCGVLTPSSGGLQVVSAEVFELLTHCGRVTQICVFNTVKLGTSASSP